MKILRLTFFLGRVGEAQREIKLDLRTIKPDFNRVAERSNFSIKNSKRFQLLFS